MTRNRVLLVDDDPEVRFGIRHYLELHGMHVTEADSVPSAKQKFLIGPADAASLTFRCLTETVSSYWSTSRAPMQMFLSSCSLANDRSNWLCERLRMAPSSF